MTCWPFFSFMLALRSNETELIPTLELWQTNPIAGDGFRTHSTRCETVFEKSGYMRRATARTLTGGNYMPRSTSDAT